MLDLADNRAPNGETINLHSGLMCYKVTPKEGSTYQSMQGKFRSVKIEFGSHVKSYQLPPKAIFFLTSEINSYGVESAYYADGEPYITEVALNHETKLILKPQQLHYLNEKREGCNEKSVWELSVEGYQDKSSKNCSSNCTAFTMPGVEFIQCTTQSDFLCSAQIFTEEFNNINEGFSTPCTKLEYSGKELTDHVIDGFPEIVQFNPKVDDERFQATIELDHPDFSWNKKPTIILSYTFDMPEKTWVCQETYVESFVDVIGVVGGTLSLYLGIVLYDTLIRIMKYWMIFVGKLKEMVKSAKSDKVGNQRKQTSTNPKKDPEQQQHQKQKEVNFKNAKAKKIEIQNKETKVNQKKYSGQQQQQQQQKQKENIKDVKSKKIGIQEKQSMNDVKQQELVQQKNEITQDIKQQV